MKPATLKKLYLLLFLQTILTLLFLFRFSLRTLIPLDFHFYVHILILILLVISIYAAVNYSKSLEREWVKPFLGMGLIVANISILVFVCNINNREDEINKFFSENENKLNNLVGYLENKEDYINDGFTENDIGVKLVYSSINDEYQFHLFNIIGYGYRIVYKENTENNYVPASPFGSPTHKWFKIKDHWYYYSYAD